MTISLGRDPQGRWLVARVTDELRLDEAIEFLRTARSGEGRYAALLFDARGATTTMTESDVDRMVDEVAAVVRTSGVREHVAIVADDDVLVSRLLHYEAGCAAIGVRVIRVFRQHADAERWLSVMVAARRFT
jgi:hypothetical protein